jgi:guanyl-specific ribonuclease Sa
MRHRAPLLLFWFAIALLAACAPAGDRPARSAVGAGEVALADLPPEAHATLALVRAGGPFPYRKDGTTFFNREGRLPERPRGYYREYTVKTPGSPDRGARRIVAGGDPPTSGEYWYTADHYRTFRRIRE